ncbi:asparaginase [Myxococcota bacterium]|nr:asparaginase [Myxococcota bacterium]MBU1380977.1 asparaginase [Myxococcota bacterium]MBU1498824.1 asparaginase [Myxococcota bacterium]
MSEKTKILHIATGGTIAMASDADGAMAAIDSTSDLLAMVPEVKSFADVHFKQLKSVDSANISPPDWLDIADIIVKNYNDFDAFVITHGTDTMAYTAAALSFFLLELDKPVILTGSQIAISVIGSDGKRNLVNAFRVACSDLAEVAIVFGSSIIRGVRARKISAFSLEAFDSINENALGEIGLSVRLSRSRAQRKNGRRLLYTPTLNKDVALVTIYPGFKESYLQHIIDTHSGVVLLGYGTGNIPSGDNDGLLKIIKNASEKGIPVIVGTQCVLGSTNLGMYRVGKSVLEAGGIPSVDMTPEAAFVKLMWVLGQTDKMERITSMMLKNWVGEISGNFDTWTKD